MNRKQAFTLYLCHTLSTYNARSYEFAAILFTSAAFPEGLRAASLVGIANSLAAILFGSAVGRWIDHGKSRLRTLLTTIILNRAIVVAACMIWLLIIQTTPDSDDDREVEVEDEERPSVLIGASKMIAFSILLGLGLVESLSRKANLIAIERDWVPVLAPPSVIGGYSLTHVNAVMGRIDMACKMVAPIAISQLIALISPKIATIVLALTNLVSVGLEIYTAKSLWNASDDLHKEKVEPKPSMGPRINRDSNNRSRSLWYRQPVFTIYEALVAYLESLQHYFSTEVWAPSLAMCFTQGSILSITGVTVVFFLESGYSLQLVTIAETASAFFELSSTFITPLAVGKISTIAITTDSTADVPLTEERERSPEVEEADELGYSNIERAAPISPVNTAISHVGLYGISIMVLVLAFTVPALFYLTDDLIYPIPRTETKHNSPTFTSYPFTSILILSCLAISRLGRGIFSLSTQQLGQSRVEQEHRSSFAGVEVGFGSLFGLAHNLGTAIFSEPREFGVLAAGSWISLACSAALYVWWMRREKVELAWWRGSGRGDYHHLSGVG